MQSYCEVAVHQSQFLYISEKVLTRHNMTGIMNEKLVNTEKLLRNLNFVSWMFGGKYFLLL